MKKPCTECPFKKKSLPGWLGEASGDPERFLAPMEYHITPCHLKVKWDEAEERNLIVDGKDNPCIGALHFLANSCKLPRGARIPGPYKDLMKLSIKNEDVFKWEFDFKKHHAQKP